MDKVIELLQQNPIYIAIIVIIAGLMVFALLKKIFKLFLILIIIALGYIGYLVYTGQSLPDNGGEIIEKIKNSTEEILEKSGEVIEEGVKKAKEAGKEIMSE